FPSNIFVHRHDGSPAAGLVLGRRDLGKCFRVLEIEGKGGCAVNKWGKSVLGAVVAGLLVLAPIYLAVLLLLKAMRSLGTVVGRSQSCYQGGYLAHRFFLCFSS